MPAEQLNTTAGRLEGDDAVDAVVVGVVAADHVASVAAQEDDPVAAVDVHAYSELILFPWGDDDKQSTDPTQNFQISAWDGLRGAAGTGYGAYIPAADATNFANRGVKVRDAIAVVRGRTHVVEQSFDLYGTSGGSSDDRYSRYCRGTGARKVWGYVIETNHLGPRLRLAVRVPAAHADALAVMGEVQSG